MSKIMEFVPCGILLLLALTFTSVQGKEVEFRTLYRRISENYLKAIPQKVIENATVELCASSCAMEVEFECKSFDIDNRNRECHLHNHTHREPLIGLQHAQGFDHYRTAYERLFSRIPNHVITLRHKRNIRGLTVEECARRCILEISFKCLGFDYEKRRKNCWLTDRAAHDVGGLVKRSNTDFYERKSHGALGKFINFGFGSLQTLEGIQTHGKIVLGVNLDACAQLCLAETSFVCASFDYVFDEQSCQLSQYIAANVHGMRTEFESSKYKVMHYELIGEYLEYFYPTPYASILGNNERTIWRVTPETCARKCLEEREFICRSFDYQIQKGTCLLSHVTGSDAGGLYTPEGVHVHYFEMKPSLDCGGILKDERGSFASPNWPRHYLHHLNCTWSIEVPEFKIIRFEIYHLDLGWQTDDPCSHDNDVLALTELTAEGRQSSTCIQNFQTQLSTSTHRANITFTTNAENDAQGFRIFYFADWPCKAKLTKDHGEFASPRWPSTYPAMAACHWHIQGPMFSKILLRFSFVELEDHTGSSCQTAYDKIEIYDSHFTTNHIKTLCGNRRADSITSSGNSLYVVFSSDSRVQAKGFHASYTFIFPKTTTTTTSTTTTTMATVKTHKETNKYPHQNGKYHAFGENSTLDKISTESVSDSTNLSLSVKMAMVAKEESDGDVIELTAIFVEPVVEDDQNADGNKTIYDDGLPSDDIGRGHTPDINYDVMNTGQDVTSVILGVFAAILFVLLVLSIAFLLVCRQYRRRLPKIRQGTNMQSPEENLSLCQDNGRKPQDGEFKDEDDVDDAARLPLPGDHDVIPDVEFHNPLYKGNSVLEVNRRSRDNINQSNIDVCNDDDNAEEERETLLNNECTLTVDINNDSEVEIRTNEGQRTNGSSGSEPISHVTEAAAPPRETNVYIDCMTTV